jgi:hypothetical protein
MPRKRLVGGSGDRRARSPGDGGAAAAAGAGQTESGMYSDSGGSDTAAPAPRPVRAVRVQAPIFNPSVPGQPLSREQLLALDELEAQRHLEEGRPVKHVDRLFQARTDMRRERRRSRSRSSSPFRQPSSESASSAFRPQTSSSPPIRRSSTSATRSPGPQHSQHRGGERSSPMLSLSGRTLASAMPGTSRVSGLRGAGSSSSAAAAAAPKLRVNTPDPFSDPMDDDGTAAPAPSSAVVHAPRRPLSQSLSRSLATPPALVDSEGGSASSHRPRGQSASSRQRGVQHTTVRRRVLSTTETIARRTQRMNASGADDSEPEDVLMEERSQSRVDEEEVGDAENEDDDERSVATQHARSLPILAALHSSACCRQPWLSQLWRRSAVALCKH